jgi:hypothetical protein
MVITLVIDGRRKARTIADLEARGIRRRSRPADAGPPTTDDT